MTDRTYLVVATPLEKPLPQTDHDAILCLGDILRYAPPPDQNPAGSVLAEFTDQIQQAYETRDIPAIYRALRRLPEEETLERTVERRYHDFFEQIPQPVYYLAGNQDFPTILQTVADTQDSLTHLSELPHFTAIDGIVPAFADLPPGLFPCECSPVDFRAHLSTTDAPVLATHSLPAEFDPAEYCFEMVLTATDDPTASPSTGAQGSLIELPPYHQTSATVTLTIAETSASEPPELTITDGESHVTA